MQLCTANCVAFLTTYAPAKNTTPHTYNLDTYATYQCHPAEFEAANSRPEYLVLIIIQQYSHPAQSKLMFTAAPAWTCITRPGSRSPKPAKLAFLGAYILQGAWESLQLNLMISGLLIHITSDHAGSSIIRSWAVANILCLDFLSSVTSDQDDASHHITLVVDQWSQGLDHTFRIAHT